MIEHTWTTGSFKSSILLVLKVQNKFILGFLNKENVPGVSLSLHARIRLTLNLSIPVFELVQALPPEQNAIHLDSALLFIRVAGTPCGH